MLSVTAPAYDPPPVSVMVCEVVICAGVTAETGLVTLIVDEASVMTSVGVVVTVRLTVLVTVNPPPVAVINTDVVLAAALEVVCSVSVVLPLSEESVTGFVLHLAVTPVGKPLTESVTVPENTLFAVSVITLLMLLP